ncbi:unnamed protein product [Trichogramma brassicae]|uniref:Reverse transcriptase domain-containing protein n=1 Tax=Trichogramma brassicae TaxID=86971 RepID=A0A6H5HXG2_9HYME|nr:unnamed protein product [Trichogramma brassicae]
MKTYHGNAFFGARTPKTQIQEYELLTVTYGTACAPYLALRVMHQLAIDKQAQHPIGSKILQENMYVDDALVSCDSEIEAIQARVDLTEILRSAGMELDINGRPNYVTLLPVDSPSLHIRKFDKDTDVSTLGLRWTPPRSTVLLPTASWGHVTSKENPADVASRGCPPGHIKNDLLWWHGPSWLLSSRTSPTTEGMEPSTELERRTERRCFATTKEDNIETVLDRFSSLNRLVRVIAYCLRWKRYLSPSKKVSLSTNVSAIEFAEARKKAICRAVQAVSFSEELKALSKSRTFLEAAHFGVYALFSMTKRFYALADAWITRLSHSTRKHPMIIPKASRFTELLIYQAHQMTLHGGPQLVQSHLCRCWWIIQRPIQDSPTNSIMPYVCPVPRTTTGTAHGAPSCPPRHTVTPVHRDRIGLRRPVCSPHLKGTRAKILQRATSQSSRASQPVPFT